MSKPLSVDIQPTDRQLTNEIPGLVIVNDPQINPNEFIITDKATLVKTLQAILSDTSFGFKDYVGNIANTSTEVEANKTLLTTFVKGKGKKVKENQRVVTSDLIVYEYIPAQVNWFKVGFFRIESSDIEGEVQYQNNKLKLVGYDNIVGKFGDFSTLTTLTGSNAGRPGSVVEIANAILGLLGTFDSSTAVTGATLIAKIEEIKNQLDSKMANNGTYTRVEIDQKLGEKADTTALNSYATTESVTQSVSGVDNKITELTAEVNAIKSGAVVRIGQTEQNAAQIRADKDNILNAFVRTKRNRAPRDGDVVISSDNYVFMFYANTRGNSEWDNGNQNVNVPATLTESGTIKLSDQSGHIGPSSNGTAKLIGYENLATTTALNGKLSLTSDGTQTINSMLELGTNKTIRFRDQIHVGVGGGECRVTSEDGSTKTLKFYGDGDTNFLNLDLGNKAGLTGVKTPTATRDAAPKGYVDDTVAGLETKLLPVIHDLVYSSSTLPSKENLLINMTPDLFKQGKPYNSLPIDSKGCIASYPPALINLMYRTTGNQPTFGVSSGHSANNRGYDPVNGFFWIGKNNKDTYISVADFNLTQTTGFTFEIECEITEAIPGAWLSPFGLSTKTSMGNDLGQSTHKQAHNVRFEYTAQNILQILDSRGSTLLNQDLGSFPLRTRINFVLTVSGTTVKGYRDRTRIGSGTLESYTDVYKWIFLNRGGNDVSFSSMKIYKLRLWRGALTPEQITQLANF